MVAATDSGARSLTLAAAFFKVLISPGDQLAGLQPGLLPGKAACTGGLTPVLSRLPEHLAAAGHRECAVRCDQRCDLCRFTLTQARVQATVTAVTAAVAPAPALAQVLSTTMAFLFNAPSSAYVGTRTSTRTLPSAQAADSDLLPACR